MPKTTTKTSEAGSLTVEELLPPTMTEVLASLDGTAGEAARFRLSRPLTRTEGLRMRTLRPDWSIDPDDSRLLVVASDLSTVERGVDGLLSDLALVEAEGHARQAAEDAELARRLGLAERINGKIAAAGRVVEAQGDADSGT